MFSSHNILKNFWSYPLNFMTCILPSRTTAKTFASESSIRICRLKIISSALTWQPPLPIITSSSLVTRERAPWTQQTQTCLSISANGGIRARRNRFETGESLGEVREVKLTVSSDKNTLGSEWEGEQPASAVPLARWGPLFLLFLTLLPPRGHLEPQGQSL